MAFDNFDKAKKKLTSSPKLQRLSKEQGKLQLNFPKLKPKVKSERQQVKKDLQNWTDE